MASKWPEVMLANGLFYIRNIHTRTNLLVDDDFNLVGYLQTPEIEERQVFRLEPGEDGPRFYSIIHTHTGKALEYSTTDGCVVARDIVPDLETQMWVISWVEGRYLNPFYIELLSLSPESLSLSQMLTVPST